MLGTVWGPGGHRKWAAGHRRQHKWAFILVVRGEQSWSRDLLELTSGHLVQPGHQDGFLEVKTLD